LKTKIRKIKDDIVNLKTRGHQIKQEKWKTQDEFRVYEREKIDELIKQKKRKGNIKI